MDTKKYMIIVKGEIKTPVIRKCNYNNSTGKFDIEYKNGKTYPYAYSNVEWLSEPIVLNPNMYQISREGRVLFDIEYIYVFRNWSNSYWHICFKNGNERDYNQNELKIVESCLTDSNSRNVLEYLKQIASLSDLKNNETGEKLLAQKYEKLTFVGKDVVLSKYLNPLFLETQPQDAGVIPIFPFGCNNSQYKAVKCAMENQISVIQGPPGTGKTQTILNIIANILIQGKTVQVVSNNKSAIDNVYEKLSSTKYNLGFIAATLGSSGNKKSFIKNQDTVYPDFSSWKLSDNINDLKREINEKSTALKVIFEKQERLAFLRQELSQLSIEFEYFKQYLDELDIDKFIPKLNRNISSKRWMEMWQKCQVSIEIKNRIGKLLQIKLMIMSGLFNWEFWKSDSSIIITLFQTMYYKTKQSELIGEMKEIEQYLSKENNDLIESLCSQSMAFLKGELALKYDNLGMCRKFSEEDLWKNPDDILKQYPVILSTTFSSRSSLGKNVVYDYVIMDEASQVDVATGALALSCARNAVIVGDTKQLPNVVTDTVKKKAKDIYNKFDINAGYQFTKSFLQSILDIMPNVTQTLLREHYRCHPKIINFCNQKFYRGKLVIMTEDNGEEDVLTAVKSVPGNHVRNHYSQRQIDIIKYDIIPKYVENKSNTGIIAPYKNQVKALEEEFTDIDVATVHKFQGKEKDNIIISTVDDEISDFVDDPYMINVAVSRAKNRLVLVVTGNQQNKERNILDLVSYIKYNNFEIVDSNVRSIFDYLYKQYAEERMAYLKKRKLISRFDSENLMFSVIEDVLDMDRFSGIDVACHFHMNKLIRNTELLNDRQRKYAMHPATHIDFLLFNRISKKPVLAVEVDGYAFHKKNTEQAFRDELKNQILNLYGIPLLRLCTNGSKEKERLIEILDKLIGM